MSRFIFAELKSDSHDDSDDNSDSDSDYSDYSDDDFDKKKLNPFWKN